MNTYIENINIERGATLNFEGIPVFLDKPNIIWNKEYISRFHFASRQASLHDRDEELQSLLDFVHSSNKFSWQALYGEAGVGKSRLALELGYSVGKNQNWEWGFIGKHRLLENDLEDLASKWFPVSNTLIIVDYVSFYVEHIKNTISALYSKSSSWDYNVRILICDRKIDEADEVNWYNRIKKSFSRTVSSNVEASEYNFPIFCKPISSDTGKEIIYTILKEKYEKDSSFLNEFEEVFEKKITTPLLALIFADAISHLDDTNVVHFDVMQLKKWLLDFELERWSKQGVGLQEKRLIRASTILNGLKKDDVSKLAAKLGLVNVNTLSIETINIVIHGIKRSDILIKIEPDLLGELFVLDSIEKELSLSKETSLDIDEELEFIKKTNNLNNLCDFLVRSSEDFPFSLALLYLIEKLSELGVKPNQRQLLSSMARMSVALAARRNLHVAKILVDNLRESVFSKQFKELIKTEYDRSDSASNYFASSAYLCSKTYRNDLLPEILDNSYSDVKKYLQSYSGSNISNDFLLSAFGLILVIYATNNMSNQEIRLQCHTELRGLLTHKEKCENLVSHFVSLSLMLLVMEPDSHEIHIENYFLIVDLIEKGYSFQLRKSLIFFSLNMMQFSNYFKQYNITTNDVLNNVHKVLRAKENCPANISKAYARFICYWLNKHNTLESIIISYEKIISDIEFSFTPDCEENEDIISRYEDCCSHIIDCIIDNENSELYLSNKNLEDLLNLSKKILNYLPIDDKKRFMKNIEKLNKHTEKVSL